MEIIQYILLSLIAFANLSLGGIIFLSGERNRANFFFLLISIITTLWVTTNLLTGYFQSLTIFKFNYSIGSYLPIIVLWWGHYFLKDRRTLFVTIILTFVSTAFAIIPHIGNLIFKEVNQIFIGTIDGEYGPGFRYYSTYLIFATLYLFIRFLEAYRKSKNIEKVQILYVMIGIFGFAVFPVIFSLILPNFGIYTFAGFDSFGTIILVGSIFYAITRHHLFDIKIIVTELFIFAIWFFMFLGIFLVNTLREKLILGGLLAALIVFGILLIRSVLNEIKNREQIQILNMQLERSMQELRKVDELKTEFVSLASHQLRTPLTPIKGYADMLRKGDFGGILEKPEQREAVENIYLSSQRMVKLIDDLLDISKLEKEGGFTYNFQIGNPERVVKEIVEEMHDQAKAKGLSLSFESTLSGETAIKFDPLKFTGAVGNIINNAVKYTKEGGIWVKLSEDDGHILISVKDTGVGINPEDIDKLFQKFFRGKEIARLATEGSGLGLYFTRRVIEDHGGRVNV